MITYIFLFFSVSSMHIVITSSMMISVFVTDHLGRKKSLILGQGFILVGWIVLYFAPKFSILILGRCLMGLGAGIIYPVTTLYLSEISLVCFFGYVVKKVLLYVVYFCVCPLLYLSKSEGAGKEHARLVEVFYYVNMDRQL